MTQRTDRIDELLRQEISELLAREIADPRIGFATVTDVETTSDLRHARVWVSVIGQPEDRVATVRALERAMPFIRHELGKRLRMRRIPEFSVKLDESIERGSRVMQIISELEAGGMPGDLPLGESLPTPVSRLHHEGDGPELVIPPVASKGRGTRRTTGGTGRPSRTRRDPKAAPDAAPDGDAPSEGRATTPADAPPKSGAGRPNAARAGRPKASVEFRAKASAKTQPKPARPRREP